jgi:DNA-binding response OmpR family regulator
MKALLVSPDARTRELMALVVRSIERRVGAPIEFLEASDGAVGIRRARRDHPDVIVADEIASHAGAFALAMDLRNDVHPFPGAVVILLDRPQDAWLAKWSGADAWFVKPVDPFAVAERILELLTPEASSQMDAAAVAAAEGPA